MVRELQEGENPYHEDTVLQGLEFVTLVGQDGQVVEVPHRNSTDDLELSDQEWYGAFHDVDNDEIEIDDEGFATGESLKKEND